MPKIIKLKPIEECNEKEMRVHVMLGTLMKQKKIKQYKLASLLGVKQGTISNWKTGRTPLPSNYVYDICEYMNITPNELFGWEVKHGK